MGYDWQDDSNKSYDLALTIKRNRGDRYWPKRESEKSGMKVVLVCGGRDYKDKQKAFETLDSVYDKYPELMIVTGSARGADLLAEEWAKSREVPYMGFPAMWKKYDKAAGMIRNKFMLEKSNASAVIAFAGGVGTAGMINLARKAGVSVWEVK